MLRVDLRRRQRKARVADTMCRSFLGSKRRSRWRWPSSSCVWWWDGTGLPLSPRCRFWRLRSPSPRASSTGRCMAHHGPMLGGGRRRAASNATATSRQEQSRSFRRIRDYAAAQALSRCLELDGAGVAAALPRMQERGVADWSSADASSSSYAGARSAAAGTTATREGLDRPRLRGQRLWPRMRSRLRRSPSAGVSFGCSPG